MGFIIYFLQLLIYELSLVVGVLYCVLGNLEWKLERTFHYSSNQSTAVCKNETPSRMCACRALKVSAAKCVAVHSKLFATFAPTCAHQLIHTVFWQKGMYGVLLSVS